MELHLALYAYWALEVLAFFLMTLWAVCYSIRDPHSEGIWFLLVPAVFVEVALAMYLSVKIRAAIHRRRPHLFASSAATDHFLTSTRNGAACMVLATTIWLVALAIGAAAGLMTTGMALYDSGPPPHWVEAVAMLIWLGYFSLCAHLLYIWVVSLRLAVFGPRRVISLGKDDDEEWRLEAV
jgi:hypothetical protein